MRKLIVCNIVSADSYYEGPGRDLMALPFAEGFSEYNAERLRAADTLLLGRTSFEGFVNYWPAIADKPDEPAVEREISRLNNAIDKVVISDQLTPERTGPWSTTRIVSRADAPSAVRGLKAGAGRDILVFGSRTMWNALLVAGLVDEVHLLVGSAFLGGGTPIFEGPRTPLVLLETRVVQKAELMLVRYGQR